MVLDRPEGIQFIYLDSPGTKTVNLHIKDDNDCEDDITQNILYFPVPDLIVISPDAFTGCAPGDIFFDNLSTPIDETYDILLGFWGWRNGNRN